MTKLDYAVAAATAFKSWDALVDDIERTGYVPTLYVHKPSTGVSAKEIRAAKMLRRALLITGHSMYPAWGKYPGEGPKRIYRKSASKVHRRAVRKRKAPLHTSQNPCGSDTCYACAWGGTDNL